jgi:hypothetical protein
MCTYVCVCMNVRIIHKCVSMYMHTFAIYNAYANVVHTHFSAPLPYTPPTHLNLPPTHTQAWPDPWVHVFDFETGKEIECLKVFFFSLKRHMVAYAVSKKYFKKMLCMVTDTCVCIHTLLHTTAYTLYYIPHTLYPLSFTHTHIHTLSLSHTHTHTRTTYHIPHTLSISLSLTHTGPYHIPRTSYPYTVTHTHTGPYHISHTSYPLSLTHTHTHSLRATTGMCGT